jgi:methyl-accepting chemotaxis protein/methyl-accepting chemotaxis protein-1 (serine sensor receptor)
LGDTKTVREIIKLGKERKVVLIPIMALLLVASALLVAQHQLNVARVDMARTLKAIDTLHLIQTHILAAENGVRDFLLTGREDTLTPLDTAQQDIPELLTILKDLLVDEPRQIAVLEDFNSLMEEELGILETLTLPGSSPSDLLTSNHTILALLRQKIETLETMLDARLVEDFEALRRTERLSLWVSGIAAILGLGGALMAALFSRGIVRGIK